MLAHSELKLNVPSCELNTVIVPGRRDYFDHLGAGMWTVFQCITLVDWASIMKQYIHSKAPTNLPLSPM